MEKYNKMLAALVGSGIDDGIRWREWSVGTVGCELARARAVVTADAVPNAALWAILRPDEDGLSVVLEIRRTLPRLERCSEDPCPSDLDLSLEVLRPTQDRVRYAVRLIVAAWHAVNRAAPSESEFESAVDRI